ncbi:hypothetical protein Pla22_23110 [Rubripirellula amarantea]|uniref:Uncharacterized protein n=2 Tax=Rubripirellula amarantea TaxID=2527999 RepID=A0A5C5WX34_9BACT|nr:hypothetical protein Pla22_23110 [Rubripirellula amarantea]
MIAFTLVIACLMFAIGRLPQLPYNVRELFAENAILASLGLAVCFVLLAAHPWWTADLWIRNSVPDFACNVLCTFAVATVVFIIIHFVAPIESIDDVVGTPVLEIGETTERWLRFIALVLGALWAQAIGILMGRMNWGMLQKCWLTLACAIGGLIVSYSVVVLHACTDNLTELLENGGKDIRAFGIPLWLAAMGWTVARSIRVFDGHPSLNQFSTISITIVASLLIGWILVNVATDSHIEKYGKTFSAIQFLLSPERSDYQSDNQVVVRFCVVHFAFMTLILAGWGMYRGYGRQQSLESEQSLEMR